jgi:ribosomal protein S18 acetylase RimI-like enzyme
VIIKSTIEDVRIVTQIAKATFFETFAQDNSPDDMDKYAEQNLNEDKFREQLSNADSEFYIVYEEEIPVGYMKLNFGQAQTELRDESSMEIERIYVKRKYHGKKYGQHLHEKAVEVARKRKVIYLWLGVWEHNLKAIGFYEKNGFVAFDKHVFKVGTDEQVDVMMKKTL